MSDKPEKSDQERPGELTPEQYRVCRQKGTEPPFTGHYYAHKAAGVYLCSCCGAELFPSEAKYDSGSGWPSFWKPVAEEAIARADDFSHGMHRIEVQCRRCGAHLGHLFTDGPKPTGLRYCINSVSLGFREPVSGD
jgi:peptide-methionine (R)-S-oxide reductase